MSLRFPASVELKQQLSVHIFQHVRSCGQQKDFTVKVTAKSGWADENGSPLLAFCSILSPLEGKILLIPAKRTSLERPGCTSGLGMAAHRSQKKKTKTKCPRPTTSGGYQTKISKPLQPVLRMWLGFSSTQHHTQTHSLSSLCPTPPGHTHHIKTHTVVFQGEFSQHPVALDLPHHVSHL